MSRLAWRVILVLSAVVMLGGCDGGDPTEPDASRVITGTVRVIDGDTLDVGGIRVRLFGIDAPEMDQRCRDDQDAAYFCGRVSARVLREAVGGQIIRCEIVDHDRYGRAVGVCGLGAGPSFNARLVRAGHALAYRRFSMVYVPEERHARRNRLGLWRGPFDLPWLWRSAL